jgi:hypothetical protein
LDLVIDEQGHFDVLVLEEFENLLFCSQVVKSRECFTQAVQLFGHLPDASFCGRTLDEVVNIRKMPPGYVVKLVAMLSV